MTTTDRPCAAGVDPRLVGGVEGLIAVAGDDPAMFDVLVDHGELSAS